MWQGPWKVETAESGCGLSPKNRLDLTNSGIQVNQSTTYWGTNFRDNGSDGTVDNGTRHTIIEYTNPRELECKSGSTDGTVWTALEGGK